MTPKPPGSDRDSGDAKDRPAAMKSGRGTERRKDTRVDDTRKVFYQIVKPRAGEGFSQNFSENGCCLLLNEELPPGSLIEVYFNLPERSRRPLRVLGRVMWQENHLTGVRFIPLDRAPRPNGTEPAPET